MQLAHDSWRSRDGNHSDTMPALLRPLQTSLCEQHNSPLIECVQEDRDEIINAMRGETKSLGLLDTADNCWATFINKVKANLHVAFTASPVGEAFRVRSQVGTLGYLVQRSWKVEQCS